MNWLWQTGQRIITQVWIKGQNQSNFWPTPHLESWNKASIQGILSISGEGLGKGGQAVLLAPYGLMHGVHRKFPRAPVRVWRETGRITALAEAWSWEQTFRDRWLCQVTNRQQWIPLFTKRSSETSFPVMNAIQTKPSIPWQDKLRQRPCKRSLSPGNLISFSPTQRNHLWDNRKFIYCQFLAQGSPNPCNLLSA